MSFLAYDKNSDYSYTLGAYPTIELLKNRPDLALRIFTRAKFYKSEGYKIVRNLAKKPKVTIEQNEHFVERVSTKENCLVATAFKKFESSLHTSENHLVLINSKDAGNLGTITRNMLAFGITNLAIVKPAVDIFNPETVRASMGAIFGLKIKYFENVEDYTKSLREDRNLYPFLTTGEKLLSEVQFKNPFSLIFGNESSGLGNEFKNCKNTIRIPQSKKVDSLNIAVSVGIALYQVYSSKDRDPIQYLPNT
jgi:TrmH family RNA methyltransferase